MDQKARNSGPVARKTDLLVQELPHETLVYDLKSDQAHCLNETTAFVWKRCDGRNTAQDIAQLLGDKVNSSLDEKLIWLALDQLVDIDLLDPRMVMPPEPAGISRRHIVRTLGLAAVVALPLVTSIIVPTAAQASTCKGGGQPCASAAQCCSGLCNSNTCV
jgi:hypothetical protein